LIITNLGDSLRCITQGDHAHFAADLLSLCRFPELESHPHRASLLEAVRLHDNGWRELDAAPRIDPQTSSPYSFEALPPDARRELWSRGARRFPEEAPRAALLIVEHALELHREHAGDKLWDEWLAEMTGLRTELLEETGLPEAELASDYRYLRFADQCSLAACRQSSTPIVVLGTRIAFSGDSLCLDPLPLTGATTFELRCRHIPARTYNSDLDLGTELATARWETLRISTRQAPDQGQGPC
jgi:hypothetical protein